MAKHWIELVVTLAVVGLVLKNPQNFTGVTTGIARTWTSFYRNLQPTGAFR